MNVPINRGPVRKANIVLNDNYAVQIELIRNLVTDHWNLTCNELCDATRRLEISWPRQVAMYLAYRIADIPSRLIGLAFGLHHSTVRYAASAVQDRCLTDIRERNRIYALTQMFNTISAQPLGMCSVSACPKR